MGENNLKIRIKHRYDTEANWNKNNPVLLSGEVAISSDKSGKHKVGDGTHKWSELSYAKAELTKGDVTGALGYTPPAKDTWRGIQNNLISTATDQSLSAAQGKWLNENKATITTLTNGNLDKITTPGFYNAGGGNSVTNKPSGVDNFGMIVVHSASGNYYTQIVYVDDKSYRRICRNGTWGNWSQDILTDGSAASVGDKNNYPFHRFAKLDTIASSYSDRSTTFFISQDYSGGGFGIVRIVLRTNNNSSVSSVEVKWLVRCGLNADSVQVGLYNVFGKTYADAFFKTGGSYAGANFRAIASGARGNATRTWVMINSSEVSGTTTTDAKTSTECYVTIADAGTKLHNQAYTNIVSGVDSGSTSYANSAGNSTKWNGYTLDITTANTKDTWLLVANNNMIQHKLTTDFADSKHTHNYAGSGSAGGSANSAVKLDTTTAGSATQPVYFSGGKPVACSYTLGKSVPADALFTDHTYGNMEGATSSAAGSAGLVPAPNIGEQLKFLRADGTWVIPTNTTYSVGTSSYSGITKLYTETGSATDGTMTQKSITDALNGKSATGHTHNYAGSSSAGGNANAAVKLATARKIGSASFDGTADITLSQMGLNVPVEITKADYLAKKKAGTLNANTYYNVIDEYDSVNVINDSSVTANSTFSSTKSEKTYAKKSTLVNTTLTASKWTGSSAPYSYVLSVSGVTSSNIVEIDYASNASSAAIEAYQNAMLADGGQTTNQITIKATEKPTVDIPITIVIRNDL